MSTIISHKVYLNARSNRDTKGYFIRPINGKYINSMNSKHTFKKENMREREINHKRDQMF